MRAQLRRDYCVYRVLCTIQHDAICFKFASRLNASSSRQTPFTNSQCPFPRHYRVHDPREISRSFSPVKSIQNTHCRPSQSVLTLGSLTSLTSKRTFQSPGAVACLVQSEVFGLIFVVVHAVT